ncbi:MAG: ATP synthase F1 subunit delta [Fimbriimonadaceae bacterium]|nr:ATP synthase F1 subunit delta [Fimbriimonadaceae bacterium]QYK56929.1 MAG: ATP synthase F1 subunit delta [Fimbriimonadaceae bacterium]
MTDARVARRYARALFNAAKKQGIVKSVEDDLALIGTVTSNTPGFRRFLNDPSAPQATKLSLFEKAFSDRVTATTMGFLRLVLEKGREDSLDLVRYAFVELRREDEGVVRAVVTTTRDLSEEERRRIVDRLTRASGKTIEAEFEIDPSLIGGIRVAYASYVLEGSVKGALDRMRERLIYDVLKQN